MLNVYNELLHVMPPLISKNVRTVNFLESLAAQTLHLGILKIAWIDCFLEIPPCLWIGYCFFYLNFRAMWIQIRLLILLVAVCDCVKCVGERMNFLEEIWLGIYLVSIHRWFCDMLYLIFCNSIRVTLNLFYHFIAITY